MKQLNKKSLRHQVGASKFGLLMIFILLAVFFTFGLKVVPLYVDHNLVTGIRARANRKWRGGKYDSDRYSTTCIKHIAHQ